MKTLNLAVFFSIVFPIMFFGGCAASSTASNEFLINTKNQITKDDNRIKPPEEKTIKPPTSESESLFVILSSVEIRENKIELNEFWGHEESEEESKLYPDNKIEIDIMNCAGYLASGTTAYTMKNGMRKVKILNETIAKDAIEKIKQCQSDNEMLMNRVFGIAPRDNKRKSIKIGKIDTGKIYESLTKDIAETKKAKADSEEIELPVITETKRNLILGDENWTDINGDGQIDLIEFHNTHCENENDTCTWIFHLVGGKWQNIEYVFPL